MREHSEQDAGQATVAPGGKRAIGAAGWWLLVVMASLGYGVYRQWDRVQVLLWPESSPPPVMASPATPVPGPRATAEKPLYPMSSLPEVEIDTSRKPLRSIPVQEQVSATPPAQTKVPPLPPLVAATPRPGGRAGLVEAMRAGGIRAASADDFDRWMVRYGEVNRRAPGREFQERIAHRDAYVVQRDFEIPGDLYGAHAVIFIVASRTPFPRGEPGHSMILDMDSGTCLGPGCPSRGD